MRCAARESWRVVPDRIETRVSNSIGQGDRDLDQASDEWDVGDSNSTSPALIGPPTCETSENVKPCGVAQVLENGRKRSANPQKSVLQFSCNRLTQVLEFMSRTRDETRLYQRARRARLKAGTWPTAPKDAPPIAGRSALAPDPASARTAIGAFPATLAGSLPATPTRSLPHGTAPVSRETTFGGSTPAIGGRPGSGLVDCGPGYPLPPDQFVVSPYGRWQANVETMLATLAAKNDARSA
jgi:hypothetical protein